VALAGPALSVWAEGEARVASEPLLAPETPAGWTTADDLKVAWQPLESGAQRSVTAHYQRDGVAVSLFLQQFLQQAQGAELVDSQDRWAAAEGEWRVLARRRLNEPAPELSQVEEVRLRDLESGREYLGWFWYRVNERESADPYVTKLLEALERLTSGELLGARVTLLTPLESGITGDAEAEARARLQVLAGAQRRAIDDALARGLADAGVAGEDAAAAKAP
jgi:EpsI family protein